MAALVRRSVPRTQEQDNYHHFVMDIAWYGIAIAATTRFIQFYALQMGATPMELGWLASLPALVLMFSNAFSLWWRNRYSCSSAAVVLPGLTQRFVFLLPAFAPFFPAHLRSAWIVLGATLPAIGQGVAATMFIVMMRETVHPDKLQRLVTRRTLVMNIAVTLGALGFGFLLERVPFPTNYQIMFVLAYVLSMVSMWHISKVRELETAAAQGKTKVGAGGSWMGLLKNRSFQSVVVVTFLIHLAQLFVAAPQPLHLKNDLKATEGFIALFGTAEVIGGTLATLMIPAWAKRYGNRQLIAYGMTVAGLAMVINALAPVPEVTLIGALLGNGAWTVSAVAILGFFTERSAPGDYKATTIWHQVIFFGMFVGPLMGSSLAQMGYSPVLLLLVGAGLRIAAGGVAWAIDGRKVKAAQTQPAQQSQAA
jgi:MFS family permease